MDAVTTYKLFAENSQKTLDRLSSSPVISREVEYYRENIGNVKSAEDLVSDQRLLNFALKAYGLEEMSYARAFIQKIVEGEADGEDGLADRLTDPRYKELADDFDFQSFGAATTSFTRATEGVVDRFFQAQLEQEAGDQNTGARLAIYFERKAEEINNAYEIIGDRALFQVIQTAFQLPEQMALQDIDKQSDIIKDRLDLEDLKDPEKVKELTNRFLNLWDTQNSSQVSVPPLVGMFSGVQSLSLDLISSLQSFRR
jgi:hypothetical protein